MLSYTLHARDRMKQRRITKDEVRNCIDNYHTTYQDARGNSIYKAHLPSGRNIKVVVAAGSSESKLVITVADYT